MLKLKIQAIILINIVTISVFMKTIAIIGAGPVGGYLAYLLAKQDKNVKVVLYEENLDVGKPVQCTGIITSSLKEYIKLDPQYIVNEMKYVEAFSEKNHCKIRSNDIIVSRTLFDQYIVDLALREGAFLKRGYKFIRINQEGFLEFKIKDTIIVENIIFTHLIGADGPNSVVSALIGNKKPQFYFGKQALVKGRFAEDTYQVFLGNDIAPKFFGWSVPENNEFSRVGVATLETPGKYFDLLLKRMNVDKKDIVEFQGGLIPVYDPSVVLNKIITISSTDDIHKNNHHILYLAVVGDAALQVKATTGGGIIPGMEAAIGLSKAIIRGRDYKKEIKHVERELKLHLLIRHTLDNFTNADYDHLVGLLSQERLKDDLLNTTRDRIKKLALKLLLKEPRLLWFGRRLLY